MLTIRLMRFGRKHQPFFRLVVVPKRGKPDRGKYVEMLGWVNPVKHEHAVDAERAKYWISVGAKPSPTAWNLFMREGIVEGPKIAKHRRAVAEEQGAALTAPVEGLIEAPPETAGEKEEESRDDTAAAEPEAEVDKENK